MEIWKPVYGYEKFYEVSNYANIRSLNRTKKTIKGLQRWNGKVLSPFIDTNGYFYVNLADGEKTKKTCLHIIVLEAFLCPRPKGLIGLHNDGKKTNCHADNLRWGTYKENIQDAINHGTFKIGEECTRAKLTLELVKWIRESNQSSIKLSEILGVASSTIRAARLRQNWVNQ